jgi:hypothetical protein
LGSWVNSKNITVREYFNLISEYGKANKSNWYIWKRRYL